MEKSPMQIPLMQHMPNMGGGGGSKTKDQAVIARLPPVVKTSFMLLSIANFIGWAMAVFGFIGWADDMSAGQKAFSAVLIFACSVLPLLFSWFITKVDWGQRGAS